MALMKLGDKAVGSIVKLKENGHLFEYIVVHQGLPSSVYDVSCNGVWLLRKDISETKAWDNSKVNKLESSAIQAYLNGDWLKRYEQNIRSAIKQVKIPYRHNGGYGGTTKQGADGISCKVFLLSGTEIHTDHNYMDKNEGAVLDYFKYCSGGTDSKRVAHLNGSAVNWWLRSPSTNNIDLIIGKGYAWSIMSDGGPGCSSCANLYGIRPAFILPADLWVMDDGTVTTNTAPSTPSSLAVPSQINGGSTITLSWGAAADAEGNLEGYKAERSLDGGTTWSQIYQGGGTSTTNTVPFGTETVMYRVKAYDSEGLESAWRTSAQVAVINNTAPTVPGSITVPEAVQGGRPLTISWGASSDGENNLAGYSLERQVDGGDWAAVYSGDQLSFTDSVTKGWLSVAYRVRAFDAASAYSGFAISETRQVNNNTPPAIACEYPGNIPLGVKNEGFEISYSVSDEEGDQVAVTEAVDGAALRTFTAELGAENSFVLGGLDWMRLLNGRHTLSITAADGASSTAHSLSFTKEVTKASVTLEQPMSADGPITVCVLAASGFIPADAQYTVMVTNNANDGAPVWEDCTAAVRSGANHIFDNSTAEEGFAFNFKLSVERGPSGQGGYITSVQGGFQ